MAQYGIDIVVNPNGAVSGARTAKRSLEQVDSAAKSALSTVGKFAGALGVAFSAGALVQNLVKTQREFDKLNAGLLTATKSAEGAAEAFAEIERFAARTPYNLEQSVQGFTRLVNLGLTPSQKALESYGNTAAAMGKDMMQMIEAVADAATGEFERLKEFGIKASSNAEMVSFTFQGTTTTVKKNAAEIEAYLMALGENQFAGAMASRMATLDGAISNLEDSWNSLFREVSAQGTGGLIEGGVRSATEAVDELRVLLASGELAGYAQALGVAWSSSFDSIAASVESVDQYIQEVFKAWRADGTDTSTWMSDAFWNFPQNIAALIKIASTEISAFADKTQIQAQRISAYLTPENWFGDVNIGDYFDQQLVKVDQRVSREYAKISGTYRKEIAATDAALRDASDRRLEYELNALNRQEVDLAKFKVKGGTETPAGDTPEKLKQQAKNFEQNANSVAKLRQELELAGLKGSELAQRQAELGLNEYATPAQIEQVRQLADQIYKLEEAKKLSKEAAQIKRDALPEKEQAKLELEEKLATLKSAYEQQLIVEKEYQDTSKALNKKYNEDITKQETEERSKRLQNASSLFDGLAGIAGTFAGEQSGLYKTLFAASKAFAIADAVIKIQQGIANAAALPFPANLAAMGSVAAATGSIVSTISGTNMQGFQSGGYTGNMGVSQVAGVVHGQEYVMDAAATRRIGVGNLEKMASGGTVGGVNVTVINNARGASISTEQISEDEVRIIVNDELDSQFSRRMTAELSDSYSDSRSLLNRDYDINRRTTR